MKQKKFDKKLVLNKETVAHLDRQEMSGLVGGSGAVCLTPAIHYATFVASCYETICNFNKTCPICPPI